jgi:hypothetical protein
MAAIPPASPAWGLRRTGGTVQVSPPSVVASKAPLPCDIGEKPADRTSQPCCRSGKDKALPPFKPAPIQLGSFRGLVDQLALPLSVVARSKCMLMPDFSLAEH